MAASSEFAKWHLMHSESIWWAKYWTFWAEIEKKRKMNGAKHRKVLEENILKSALGLRLGWCFTPTITLVYCKFCYTCESLTFIKWSRQRPNLTPPAPKLWKNWCLTSAFHSVWKWICHDEPPKSMCASVYSHRKTQSFCQRGFYTELKVWVLYINACFYLIIIILSVD